MQSTSEDPQFHSFIRKWQRIKNQFLISCRIINQCKTFSFFFLYIYYNKSLFTTCSTKHKKWIIYNWIWNCKTVQNISMKVPQKIKRTPPKEDSMCEPFFLYLMFIKRKEQANMDVEHQSFAREIGFIQPLFRQMIFNELLD